jgi:DNA-binding transcriptional MocR family regulator
MARGTLASATSAASPPANGGIHVWHTLPSYWRALDLAAVARDNGLVVAPAEAFSTGPHPPNAIRISLGGCPGREQLDIALRKLSKLLAQKPTGPHEVVI